MKKSLLVLAVLGAAAVSANAGNVTLYGAVDGGFAFTHSKEKNYQPKAESTSSNSFQLKDGLATSNKFGIKGEEKISDDLTVGFKLENGFHIANGTMKGKDDGVLFDREALLYAKGVFGEIGAGRVGALGSGAGSYDMFLGNVDAFGGEDQLDSLFYKTPRLNNSLTYVTPDLLGFKAYAQYSFSAIKGQADKFNKNDRMYGLGVTYQGDNFTIAGLFQQELPATSDDAGKAVDSIKTNIFGLGGNVVFNNVTVYGAMQYARNVNGNSLDEHFDLEATEKFNFLTLSAGASVDVDNNNFIVAGYYANGKFKDSVDNQKVNAFGLDGRYTYNLSKRTSVYVGLDSLFMTEKANGVKIRSYQDFSAYTGLTHKF